MSSAKSASLWAVLGSIGTRGLSFIFFLLIARALSPAQLGVMALALALAMFLDAVVEFGLVDQVVRHPGEDDQQLFCSVFWLHALLGLGALLLMALLAPFVAQWYGEPQLQGAVAGVAVASAFTALALVPSALLTRRLAQRTLAQRNTLATLVGGGLGLALAHAGWGVGALVVMHVANALTCLVVAWIGAGWWPRHRPRLAELKPVLPLAKQAMAARLIETLIGRLDQLVIGALFGTATLGLYALAMRLYDTLFQTVCMPIAQVMLPYLSPAAGERLRFREKFLLVLETTAWCTPPLFLLAALFLPDLMPLLFGERWQAAVPYIQVIMGIGVIQAATFTHTPAFSALGKPWANLMVAVMAATAWLLALLFLPALGALFAAILWAARGLLGAALQLLLMRRLAGIRLSDYWQATRGPLVTLASVLSMVVLFRAATPYAQHGLWLALPVSLVAAAILAAAAFRGSAHVRTFVQRGLKGI